MLRQKRPEVTIAMPVYNGGTDLKQAIESLLGQDYPNLKFIIADDCSTDGSYEYLEGQFRNDARFTLYKNTRNLGVNGNYNNLFQHITNEFFMFADQDDFWEKKFISESISLFEKYPQISSATAHAKSVSNDLQKTFFIDPGLSTVGLSPVERFKKYRLKLHSGQDIGGIFCAVHKTAIFKKGMPLKKVLGNDHLAIATMSLESEFLTSDKVLFTKRRGGSSDNLKKVARLYGIKTGLYFTLLPLLPREIEFQKIIFNANSLSSLKKINLSLWSLRNYFFTHHIKEPFFKFLLLAKHVLIGREHISTFLRKDHPLSKKIFYLIKVLFRRFKK